MATKPRMPAASGFLDGGGLSVPAVNFLSDIERRLSESLKAQLDEELGGERGSILHYGEDGWSFLAPGNGGDVLTSGGVGADVAWAAPTANSWVRVGSVRTVTGVEDFTNLGAYQEIIVAYKNVTSTGIGFRQILVSTDNGSTFLNSSGDYHALATTPSDVSSMQFSTSAEEARSGALHITGFNKTSVKVAFSSQSSWLIGTSSPLNAIRLRDSVGTPNGGTIEILGLPG